MPEEESQIVKDHHNLSQNQTWIDVFIALGSNLNDPPKRIDEAIQRLTQEQECQLVRVSPYLHNPPMGPQDQPDFVNAVILIKTRYTPQELLKHCQKVEHDMGRTRQGRWGPRVIDCDIILYGQRTINQSDLTIPHPGLLTRVFVYGPLLTIAPTITLPCGSLVSSEVTLHEV